MLRDYFETTYIKYLFFKKKNTILFLEKDFYILYLYFSLNEDNKDKDKLVFKILKYINELLSYESINITHYTILFKMLLEETND